MVAFNSGSDDLDAVVVNVGDVQTVKVSVALRWLRDDEHKATSDDHFGVWQRIDVASQDDMRLQEVVLDLENVCFNVS